jgi:hypothetical protein
MGLEDSKEKPNRTDDEQQESTNQAGRPPPSILTSVTYLIQLHKQLKGILKDSSEFRSARNGTRFVTKEMAHFSTAKSFFTFAKTILFYLLSKNKNPVKASVRHLPSITPAEELYKALVELAFDIMSVKHMTTTHRSPSEKDPKKSSLPPLPYNSEQN